MSALVFSLIFLQPNIVVPEYIDALKISTGNPNVLNSVLWVFRGIIIVIWIAVTIEQTILWYKKLNQKQ